MICRSEYAEQTEYFGLLQMCLHVVLWTTWVFGPQLYVWKHPEIKKEVDGDRAKRESNY